MRSSSWRECTCVTPELTLAVNTASARLAQKVARTCVPLVSVGVFHTATVSSGDHRKLASFSSKLPHCRNESGAVDVKERDDFPHYRFSLL